MRMHDDQVDITPVTVARLVASQFPHWRDLPVRAVTSHGTVNALFRLGDEIVLRFPLRPGPDAGRREELRAEQDTARRVAAHVPVPVPEPVGFGEPGEGYPGPWTAYSWIPGETASRERIGDPDAFARDLAGFVSALHGMDTGGHAWNGRGRGGPLQRRDESVRRALAESARLTDTARLAWIWVHCLQASRDAADVWIHTDLMPAWNLLAPGPRQVYRRALGVSDATWERGRGWAIVQAIVALPYYVDTNRVMADTARRTLDAVLDEARV